ncbi:MAG: HD domain-containing protein [Clostridiales bacterium]|nr:HD domain-containing protein [Clostridiales bacterium]
MRNLYYETTMHRQIRDKRDNRKERIRGDIDRYGREVLESDEMKEAYEQTHHLWSTVGEHTLRVTLSSVMACYALKKLHIKVNIPAVVVGALCHDLGMLGREHKYASEKEAHHEHPGESVRVAKEIVEDLPAESEEIIERHMWPMGGGKAPSTIEGLVVSTADKYTAVKDLVKGSDVKNTGVRNVANGQKKWIQENLRKNQVERGKKEE